MTHPNEPHIVELSLTTDSHCESGETVSILVDAEKVSMINGRSLFRKLPGGPLMIVRNPEGQYLQRPNKDGVGVSLTSYLFGKLYMRRVNKDDNEDYTEESYVLTTGRPAQIDVLRTPESLPCASMYKDEYLEWKKQDDAAKLAKSKKSTQPEEAYMTDHDKEMTRSQELAAIKNRIENVKVQPKGTEVQCPCCSKLFIKPSTRSVYCSSYNQDNAVGCKERLNSKMTELRKKIAAEQQEPKPQPTVNTTVDPVVETPDNGGVFKTVNGIPLTLGQTKALLFSNKDQSSFMTIKGMSFSLTEMRKLLEME